MGLDSVTSFSRIKNLRNTRKRLYYSHSSWRDFFSCYVGNMSHLKDTLAFSSNSVVELKQCLAYHTSDFLPNI